MKIEIEFKAESVNASQISQKLFTILNSVKQQGLDAKEFSIEMDIGSDATQFTQKTSPVFDSIEQQGLDAKEFELEINTASTGDISQTMQKISPIVDSIKEQGFNVKELEIDAEKEEQREDKDLLSYFNDVNDNVSKVLEVLDESKETIEIYKETDFRLSSEKTNKILSFLTILFTLSIPITVLGTFYGMNI